MTDSREKETQSQVEEIFEFLQNEFSEIQRINPERTTLEITISCSIISGDTNLHIENVKCSMSYKTAEGYNKLLPYDYESMVRAVNKVESHSRGDITGTHYKYWYYSDVEHFVFRKDLSKLPK